MGKVKRSWRKKIINMITDILNVKRSAPIGIKWREEEMTGSIHSGNCDIVKVKNVSSTEGSKNNRQVNNARRSGDFELAKHTELQLN
jgi:hypothetical protein